MVGPFVCFLPSLAGVHGDDVLAIHAQSRGWPGCAIPLPAVSFVGDRFGGHGLGLNEAPSRHLCWLATSLGMSLVH